MGSINDKEEKWAGFLQSLIVEMVEDDMTSIQIVGLLSAAQAINMYINMTTPAPDERENISPGRN